jgi:hypothetical protein
MPDIVRDPDTGEFRSVDDSQRAGHPDRPPIPSWGSAYVQHVGWGVTQEMDDDELLAAEATVPVLAGRLDSNEVAELIGLDVEPVCYYLTDAGSGDDPSGALGVTSLGVNMSTEEDPYFRNDLDASSPSVYLFGSSSGDFSAIGGQTGSGDSGVDGAIRGGQAVVDRPGFLAGRVLAPTTSYEDAAAGSGGAGHPVASDRHTVDYRDRFHTGPVVDQSDELTWRGAIGGGDGVTGEYRIAMRASLYWQVAQVPGGRPDFSLPNL